MTSLPRDDVPETPAVKRLPDGAVVAIVWTSVGIALVCDLWPAAVITWISWFTMGVLLPPITLLVKGRSLPMAMMVLAGTALTAGVAFVVSPEHEGPPMEAELLEQFESHETLLGTIADRVVSRGSTFELDRENRHGSGADADAREILAMMREAGIKRAGQWHGGVELTVYSHGLSIGGSSRGYFRSSELPDPVVESLEEFTRSIGNADYKVYVRLGEDCYIYAERW